MEGHVAYNKGKPTPRLQTARMALKYLLNRGYSLEDALEKTAKNFGVEKEKLCGN